MPFATKGGKVFFFFSVTSEQHGKQLVPINLHYGGGGCDENQWEPRLFGYQHFFK